ncbi:hypothetical protein IJE86_01655, partial [bacterium]|nr:hypothetical protein [bacterium]
MEELKNNLKYCLKVVAIWGLLFLLLCIMVQVSGTLFVNQPDILSFICLGFIVLGCVTPVLVNKNKSSKPTNKFVDKVFSRFDIFTIFLVGMYIFVVVMDVEKFSENFISNFLNFLLLYTFFYLYLINWNAKKYSVTAKSEAQKEIIMLIKSLAFIACPVFFINDITYLLSLSLITLTVKVIHKTATAKKKKIADKNIPGPKSDFSSHDNSKTNGIIKNTG